MESDIHTLSTFELFKEYRKVTDDLLSLKNEEVDFLTDHPNRDMWDDDEVDDYGILLENIHDTEVTLSVLSKEADARSM